MFSFINAHDDGDDAMKDYGRDSGRNGPDQSKGGGGSSPRK
jgi:hypothetical protein